MHLSTSLWVFVQAFFLLCAADTHSPGKSGDPQSAKGPDSFKGPGIVQSAKAPDGPESPKGPVTRETPEGPKVGNTRESPESRENQLEADIVHHFQHLTYVAEFTCREPQARVMPVERLLPSSVTWGKAYYPDVTVVHMCENSGACSSGFRCGPSHVTSVHLPFKVTYLEDVEYHKKGSWSMEFHLLENHTHCACAEEVVTERPRPVPLSGPTMPPPTPPVRPTPNYNPSFNPSFNNNINPSPIRPPIPPPLSNAPSSPRIQD